MEMTSAMTKAHPLRLALLLFSLWLAGACGQGSGQGSGAGDTLRVMTYNIHHANPPSKARDSVIDIEAVARVIREAGPDLVALQEIDVHNTRSGVDLHEAEALAGLTGMHCYFAKAMDYRGGAYGDAVLSRFPIEDNLSYQLPAPAGTREEVRSLAIIKVRLPGGQETYFASTHLGLSEEARLLQARRLKEILTGLSLPVIIGGDFNATPESAPIRLLDSALTRSCLDDCPLTIPTEQPRHTIDYLMFRPAEAFRALRTLTIPETYASDHLPVVAELVY